MALVDWKWDPIEGIGDAEGRRDDLYKELLRDEAVARLYELGKYEKTKIILASSVPNHITDTNTFHANVSDAGGYLERTFMSPASIRAGNLIRGWMEDAGLRTWVDCMGNVHGRFEGKNASARTLLIGSHLDTVVDAGMFDGSLGIISAVSAVKALKSNEKLGELRRPVEDGKKEVKFAGRLHMRVSLDGGYHVFDESIHYISDYRASAKLLWTPTIGVLELGILNANGLLPMKSRDGRGTTDAYCVAKYGHKWIRTRTIVDSFAPQWNEQYTWEVYDPYTVITIGVFDNCHLQGGGNPATTKDPRIGKVRIRLSTLETDRIYTHSYPLIVLQPNGVKKMGEIQLAVRFTCSSMFDMLQAYMQPLLPTMHYVQPLSVYQLDSLRHQATHIVSLQLARNEPPLRKEVVEYMLDVGSHMWSLRRGRTNFERLLTFFKGIVGAWKWFDKIRKWKSPVATILTHVLFLLLVFFPHRVLPVVFLWCFVVGIVGYRRRPRHPPQIDIKMSNAESVQGDELDEEFDTFPSSKKGDVLRMRYDRLRGIAGRMMTVLGDLATQGERVQSLLSWRDPRATSVFIIFSLVACILLSLIPLRTLIIAHGFYAMRHPRLRIDIPSIPKNFFRRLPTRADSML
ncbi:FT-interacting protein 1-like [Carica papaya]|uniref:FT-interacting protein 1-like n=1 Tax=Carica papaya TaxID=3649 RepID=UPI000B8CA0BD|nr:FT-interacting protein 1-like [Carica papaya]